MIRYDGADGLTAYFDTDLAALHFIAGRLDKCKEFSIVVDTQSKFTFLQTEALPPIYTPPQVLSVAKDGSMSFLNLCEITTMIIRQSKLGGTTGMLVKDDKGGELSIVTQAEKVYCILSPKGA
jgi:hypothetical protein